MVAIAESLSASSVYKIDILNVDLQRSILFDIYVKDGRTGALPEPPPTDRLVSDAVDVDMPFDVV